jgi:hypothetical protein
MNDPSAIISNDAGAIFVDPQRYLDLDNWHRTAG